MRGQIQAIQEVSRDFYHACRENRATFEDLQRFLLRPEVRLAFERYFGSDHRVALSAFALAFFEIEPTLTGVAGTFLGALMESSEATGATSAPSVPMEGPLRRSATPLLLETVEIRWAQYRLLFQAWKEADAVVLSQTLSQMYWEYELNYRIYENHLTPDEREYYTEEKQRRQEECLGILKTIGGGMEYFQTFTPVFVDTETSTLLMQVLRRAFWDRMTADLTSEPPVFKGLFVLLREIREHLETIIGRSRPEWIIDYDEYFDTEFLQQRAAHPASLLTLDFWMPRCEKLAELLIALDSAVRQPHHESMLRDFKNAVAAGGDAGKESSIRPFMGFLEYFMTRLLELVQTHQAVFQN
jgi:T-complex protein 11